MQLAYRKAGGTGLIFKKNKRLLKAGIQGFEWLIAKTQKPKAVGGIY